MNYAHPGVREKIRSLYLGAAGAIADEAIADVKCRRVLDQTSELAGT